MKSNTIFPKNRQDKGFNNTKMVTEQEVKDLQNKKEG